MWTGDCLATYCLCSRMQIGMTMLLMSTCKYSSVTHQLSSLEAIYNKAAACMHMRQGVRITINVVITINIAICKACLAIARRITSSWW